MARRKSIRKSEWLAELSRLVKEAEPADPGYSIREIAEELGLTVAQETVRMRTLEGRGVVVRGKAMRRDPAGNRRQVNVYRPADAK